MCFKILGLLEKLKKYIIPINIGITEAKHHINRINYLEVKKLLKDIKNSGKIVAGYGATSKSTTILNYCKVDSSLISFISDSTQEKIGKFSPGSGIPIFSHEKIRNNPPDYIVLFAWNHKDEILEKESELRKQNLKWISLCPVIEILEYND